MKKIMKQLTSYLFAIGIFSLMLLPSASADIFPDNKAYQDLEACFQKESVTTDRCYQVFSQKIDEINSEEDEVFLIEVCNEKIPQSDLSSVNANCIGRVAKLKNDVSICESSIAPRYCEFIFRVPLPGLSYNEIDFTGFSNFCASNPDLAKSCHSFTKQICSEYEFEECSEAERVTLSSLKKWKAEVANTVNLSHCLLVSETEAADCIDRNLKTYAHLYEPKNLINSCDQVFNDNLKNTCLEITIGLEMDPANIEKFQSKKKADREKLIKNIIKFGIPISIIVLAIVLMVIYRRFLQKLFRGHLIAGLFGIIGLALPLAGFINEDWIEILFFANPFAFILSVLFLGSIIGDNMIASVISLSLMTALFYFLIGLIIEKIIKSKNILIIVALIIGVIIGIIGLSYIGYQMLMGLGAALA